MLRIIIATSDETSRNFISHLASQTARGRVVASVHTEESLVRAATYRRSDLAFVSTRLDGMRGFKAAETLTRQWPKLHVVMMSPHGNDIDEILRAMKIGARECLAEPLTEDAVLRVLDNAQHGSDSLTQPRGAIILVLSSRGGVGKSTIAVNLAIAFRQRYAARVALIDGDLHFGDLAILLNIKSGRTIHELNRSLAPEIATRFLHKHSSGVEVLPAPRRQVQATSVSRERFREILRVLQNLYDLIIVDSAMSDTIAYTLDVADAALVVCTPDVICLKDVHHLIDALHRLQVPFDHVIPVGNRFDDRLPFSREDAEKWLGMPFATLLPRDDRNVLAGNQGIPLIISNPYVPFVQAITALATLLRERSGTVHRAVV